MWGRLAAAVFLLCAGIVLSGLVSHGSARAESTSTSMSATTATTTTSTTSTAETSTASSTTSSTSAATTAAQATTVTTTTSVSTTRTHSMVLVPITRSTGKTCAEVAAIVLLLPGRAPLLLSGGAAQRGRLAYPANGTLATIGRLRTFRRCSQGRHARGWVAIRSFSLFGGAVTAKAVAVEITRAHARSPRINVRGLRVDGRTVATHVRTIKLGRWALVTIGRFVAASGAKPHKRRAARAFTSASALAVHLLKPRAGLPRGASVLVAFAELRVPRQPGVARKRIRAHKHASRPLKVTPKLGLRGYVFPVAGAATFSDSYGAFRPDVTGNWHHGDDIFARVGTPVVAVANGRLNRVGWEVLGGWRLWVRDRLGNEFYYAHLSGYSPLALRSRRVKAGELLGFVGNTGDAFTTPFHLHFEIHPHQLLFLHYDGAVDPTTYLERWRHLEVGKAPRPVLPPSLPAGDPRREARFVFGELLAARGFAHHRLRPPSRIRLPGVDAAVHPSTAAHTGAAAVHSHGSVRQSTLFMPLTVLSLGFTLALGGAGTVLYGRRRRSER